MISRRVSLLPEPAKRGAREKKLAFVQNVPHTPPENIQMFTILDWKDGSTNTPDISLGLRRAGTWTRLPCPGSQPGQDVNSLYLGYKIPASRPPISAQGSPQPKLNISYVAPTGASSPGELEEAT